MYECTKSQPINDVRYTLSYVVDNTRFGCIHPGTSRMRPYKGNAGKGEVLSQVFHLGDSRMNIKRVDLLSMISDALNSVGVTPSMIQRVHAATTKEDILRALEDHDCSEHSWFGKEGKYYTKIEEAKKLPHPSPKRLNLSVKCGHTYYDCNGYRVNNYYMYPHNGRPPIDWRCTLMTLEVARLIVSVWEALRVHLTPLCQLCPPNAVQVCHYFSLLKGRIPPHRDNGVISTAPTDECGKNGKKRKINVRSSIRERDNSQMFGSDVLVICAGDDMVYELMDNAAKNPRSPTATFKKEFSVLRETMRHGSVYILDSRDDENYLHTAFFQRPKGSKMRNAFVCRWLTKICPFYIGREDRLKNALAIPNPWRVCSDYGSKKNWELWIKALIVDNQK